MKKADVKVGGVYAAKVSGKVVPVRIESVNGRGGWDAMNTVTGRKVRIKSAQRLRGPSVTGAEEAALGRAAEDVSKVLGVPVVAAGGKEKKAPGTAKKKAAPKAKSKKAKAPRKKRPGLLDLAAEVLAKAKEPMDCKAIVKKVLASGHWQTKGKTPAATLYSAIIREMAKKGKAARFQKVGRGKFTHTGSRGCVSACHMPRYGRELRHDGIC